MNRKTVVIGILGTTLDRPPKKAADQRWSAWRPTVSICQNEDLIVDRFELLHMPADESLADVVQRDIESVSPETDVHRHSIEIDDPWDFEEVYAALHDFSRSQTFDPDQNDYLIHITTGTHVQQICLFLLTESRHLPGRLLQTSPPKRKRGKPISAGRFKAIDLDLSRYDAIASRFSLEQKESLSYLKSGIETRNKAFNRLIEQIEKVTLASSAPVLLTGPTGAGKSQLARRIFELKKLRQFVSGDLVEVNCATLRGDQAMSALFGHKKGAFTGAVTARKGLLAQADNGVLFLDEIGELGLDEQAMLLRAIEDKQFQAVGADETTESDFQLIAGTNQDLGRAVSNGDFREDLLARINLWDFRLPGLADRREDIEPNLEYELEKFSTSSGTRITMNKEAKSLFLKFAKSPKAIWRANFRDLNGAVTRMGTLASSGRIGVSQVKEEIARLKRSWQSSKGSGQSRQGVSQEVIGELIGDAKMELDLFDEIQLSYVLEVCQHSKSMSEAGRKLFQVSRLGKKQPNDSDRLRKYLAKYGISWRSVSEHFG